MVYLQEKRQVICESLTFAVEILQNIFGSYMRIIEINRSTIVFLLCGTHLIRLNTLFIALLLS